MEIQNDKKLDLTQEQIEDIEKFLINRFDYLERGREDFDTEIRKEIDIYNNIDTDIDEKEEWEEKYKIPYLYSVVQTMVARLLQSLFSKQNYLKAYIEEKDLLPLEGELTQWLQSELDKAELRYMSRDFLEESLIQRLCWLHLRPIKSNRKGRNIDIDFEVYKFFDVWFDLKAKDVMDTDIFVRKMVKHYKLLQNRDNYYDSVNDLTKYDPSEYDRTIRDNEYTAKHAATETRPQRERDEVAFSITTDEIEVLEYYGVYDFNEKNKGEDGYVPDVKEVIFTLANRTTLIRAAVNTLDLDRKRLMFPIRPLRQATSLVGKSVPQLVGDLARELNSIRSLRMDNFNNLIKLLWKYNKNADIDLDEMFAGGGNAVGWETSKDDVDIFPVPNMVNEASFVANETIGDIQHVLGAADPVMGNLSGSSTTASEVRTVTEQAMFKFNMFADNVAADLIPAVNYAFALLFTYNREWIETRVPKLNPLLEELSDPKTIEDSYIIDFSLSDISQRRDVERHQWSNAIGVIAPLVQQSGGNMTELLRQFMNSFQMENIDKILSPEDPSAIALKLIGNPELMQQVMSMLAQAQQEQQGGGEEQNAQGVPEGSVVENEGNENLDQAGGIIG